MINQNPILKEVLHVHNLSANLIFVHKLTIDLHCLVFFNPITCQFQDQGTRKLIGLAKEAHGLYLLEDVNRMHSTKSDVWGPSRISNLFGTRWFDDCTQGPSIFLSKQKSEVGQVFKSFIQTIKNQFGSVIKRVHLDSAKDYFNQTLFSFNEQEVIHEYS